MADKAYSAGDVRLPGWDASQVAKAVQSLLKYIGKQHATSMNLLEDEDEMLYLQLSLKTMPLQTRKDKPVPLPLPHPLLSPEGAEICLFVKDHLGEGHKAAKKRLEGFERKGGIAKVVGLSKLRTKYESHEAKRELCKLYDLFLADERILPSLPKLIGKSFFKKKKQPIPVDLTVKDFPAQVKRACAATYLYKTSGTCINLRVARSSQGPQAIAENIYAALVQAVEHIPKKWGNIQGVFLKTSESVALPIYQTLPDGPKKIGTGSAPAVATVVSTQDKTEKADKQSKATIAGSAPKAAGPAASKAAAQQGAGEKRKGVAGQQGKPAGKKQQR